MLWAKLRLDGPAPVNRYIDDYTCPFSHILAEYNLTCTLRRSLDSAIYAHDVIEQVDYDFFSIQFIRLQSAMPRRSLYIVDLMCTVLPCSAQRND
jgi:hypothetical protein